MSCIIFQSLVRNIAYESSPRSREMQLQKGLFKRLRGRVEEKVHTMKRRVVGEEGAVWPGCALGAVRTVTVA